MTIVRGKRLHKNVKKIKKDENFIVLGSFLVNSGIFYPTFILIIPSIVDDFKSFII